MENNKFESRDAPLGESWAEKAVKGKGRRSFSAKLPVSKQMEVSALKKFPGYYDSYYILFAEMNIGNSFALTQGTTEREMIPLKG